MRPLKAPSTEKIVALPYSYPPYLSQNKNSTEVHMKLSISFLLVILFLMPLVHAKSHYKVTPTLSLPCRKG